MGSFFALIALGILVYWVFASWIRRSSGTPPANSPAQSGLSGGGSAFVSVRGNQRGVDALENARAGDRLWVAPGRESKVAGGIIPGGMIYLGKSLAPIKGWQDVEPSLIDPSLPVSGSGQEPYGDTMGYWPSYCQISPKNRSAHLEWLKSGRSDPNADIGFVFLFLYGLERRLLFELMLLPELRGEAPVLISEVERLLALYGQNRSFHGYATDLLSTARILWDDKPASAREPTYDHGGGRVPAAVRVALGQLVAAGEPIPGIWALAWVIGHPETRLRTPARRCPEEFRKLFLARYVERYGSGILVKPNKTRLKIIYHPASSSFGGEVAIPVADLPDVAALSRPVRQLQEIAETAMSELEGFSRYIAKNPQKASSLEALSLLPAELALGQQTEESKRLREWIDAVLNGRAHAVVSGDEVIAHWPCAGDDRISKAELGSFVRMLETLDCGLEPDPRFGGNPVSRSQKLILFRLGADRVTSASAEYRAATLLLHLAAAVSASDGDVSEAEIRQLEEHINRSMHFGDAESRRLRAHVQSLLVEKPSLAGFSRRLEGVDSRQRRLLAEFVVAIAGADGVIDPGEVKTIIKIYKLLGFDPDQAFADIHSLQSEPRRSPAERPVTVRPAGESDPGFAIPGRPQTKVPTDSDFHLDRARVERTLADTAAVSSLLAEIFVEDENVPTTSQPALVGVSGLGARHSELLRLLDGVSELSREKFESLAEGLGLLSDGAYELINEAAFERIGRPLLEQEDPILVDLDGLEEMRQ